MTYDIIVIGAGHAGIEASLAASRMGLKTLLFVLDKNSIGQMSCNPAIGGVGKGQLVKEIDALGGEMAKAADTCGIQFRILNSSKGPAVQSSRAQIDRHHYVRYMQGVILAQDNIEVKEAEVAELLVKDNTVYGVRTCQREEFFSTCVIIATGTFLDGLIHVGLKHESGGRIGEQSAISLDHNLRKLGFELLRFKTGTCCRLDKNTLDFRRLKIHEGDSLPVPFSFLTSSIKRNQVPCYLTHTNTTTHKIIQENLDRSPLYTGIIKATGVRYCPSIEDKIVRFRDKERHQVFLEPEGESTDWIYPNGLSTSLPEDVQLKIVHSIDGLQEAKVLCYGYGIEHSVVEPTQNYPTLETKLIRNLYLAGQINGTTGYEEAAAQGLIAGMNAALRVQKKEPFILDRASSYIGVLIDDLTIKGTQEPYRMFTSRVEYRLIIREDNADLRLSKYGYDYGLIKEKDFISVQKKAKEIKEGRDYLENLRLKPSNEINEALKSKGLPILSKPITLADFIRRPQVTIDALSGCSKIALPEISRNALKEIEIEIKYAGFISRQLADVERFKHLEKIRLPENLDYASIQGLSREIREKLLIFKPLNLGQASRISGVTPTAIMVLMIYLRKIPRDA